MTPLILLFSTIISYTLEVHNTSIPPVIDGFIEMVWKSADSAYNFIQCMPFEKVSASEITTAYVLQDKENIYVAFKCYTLHNKPITQFGINEDFVTLFINPYRSKTTAYFFKVYASGRIDDGMILDDGRIIDDSWDGVWYHAVGVYNDRYEVEIRIPLKTMRRGRDVITWGGNFKRYIAAVSETDYWTEVLQIEGNKVSKFGCLTGINLTPSDYYLELYPEATFRFEEERTLNTKKLKPMFSLNMRWDITSETSLSATTFPDFAQIEADPYVLNLSKYEVRLDEKRPFFIEGKEIFASTWFGDGSSICSPLELFYSRRIGKSINDTLVPIIGGLKFVSKSEAYNLGLLGVYTGSAGSEQRKVYQVLRLRKLIGQTHDMGLLLSTAMVDWGVYNLVGGLDATYRKSVNQFMLQYAISKRSSKSGWATFAGFSGFLRSLETRASLTVVSDSFNANDIGYVPWTGLKKMGFTVGPFNEYKTGILRALFVGPTVTVYQEPDFNGNWAKDFFF